MDIKNKESEVLLQNGYIVLSNILDIDTVEKARIELDQWFQEDLDSRQENNVIEAHYPDGPFGHTILTEPAHLALNVYTKSHNFDSLIEKVFSSEEVKNVIEAWSGPNYKVSSVNIRYMTGAINPPPAHELHRDDPGSMNIGIMLTDVEEGDNGATAVVPGSHWSALDPRWDCLFEEPFRLKNESAHAGLKMFLNWNIFNRLLKKKTLKPLTGIFGKQGDVYFFANGEVWHGRLPNMYNKRAMICLMGLRAVDAENVHASTAIPKEVLDKLSTALTKILVGPFEINNPDNTLRHHIYSTRKSLSVFSLQYWAKLERKWAEWISIVFYRVQKKLIR